MYLHKQRLIMPHPTQSKINKVNNALIFSTTFSSRYKEVNNVIQKYMPLLYQDQQLTEILKVGCKFVAKKPLH